MTQLDLLDFAPQVIAPPAPTGRAESWHITDLYSGLCIAGPFATPEDAIAELDDLDPEGIRYRLAFRPTEEI